MSSRVNYKYEDEDLSERSFKREQKYGQSSSPYRVIDEPSVEFSFKQISQNRSQIQDGSRSLYKSQSIISLKQNLQQLPKSEIIELLIQQINFSQSNPTQRQRLNEKLKEINRPKDSSYSKKEEPNYKRKYDQLVRDFQQYINNTRQAQQHYVKIIQDLKKQNKSLQNQLNRKPKDSNYSPNYSPRSHNNKSSLMVEKLQQSVQNYIRINNQLIGKVQRLERINKQNSEQTLKLKQENQLLKQDNEFMVKEIEKLKKQNTSFKSIVDELKDYIMERRQAKEQVGNNLDTQRSNISQKAEMRQKDQKYQMQKYQEDSIIESSQIKRRQLTLNDSTLMFEKDSQTISNLQYQVREQKRHQNLKQNQDNQDDSQDYLKITETLKMVQAQNKVLKITNEKLQHLLQKKSQKVKIMMQEIQTLKIQNDIANQEIIQLKSKMKKSHSNSYNNSTTASKSLNQEYKLGLNKQQMYAKSQYLKDSLSEAFSKRYSHCTQSQMKKKQDSNHYQVQQQNKNEENKQKKTFNLESFNLLKGQTEAKPAAYQDKHAQKNPEQYYIPRTLIASNKKF